MERVHPDERAPELLGHVPVHPVYDRPRRDEERDTDEHADQREAAFELLRSKHLEGEADRFEQRHYAAWSWSVAINPSCRVTTRAAWAAMSRSCVTITIVWPRRCRAPHTCMISPLVAESRFPVGSSAGRVGGAFTGARRVPTG